VNTAELDRLVAQIGEELLARLKPAGAGCPVCGGSSTDPAINAATGFATLLSPRATAEHILKACADVRRRGSGTIYVSPCWVVLAVAELRGSSGHVGTVVGYPYGTTTAETKILEAEVAVRTGASEIALAVNAGALRSGDHHSVRLDMQGVARVCARSGVRLWVILDAAILNDREREVLRELARGAGLALIDTGTLRQSGAAGGA
jgi:deoxyribose-phosphate aldolase